MAVGIGQQHRGQPGQRAELDQHREPRPADAVHRQRDRVGHAELAIRHQPGQHRAGGDVQHGAHRQRAKDAHWHVAAGIARLGRGGGNGLETEIGEEQHRRAAQHARPAVGEAALVGGDERPPVARIDEPGADRDEGDQHRDLDRHQQRIGRSRAADAEDHGQRGGDRHQRRDRVEAAAEPQLGVAALLQRLHQRRGERGRHLHAEVAEQAHHIAGKPHRHRRRGQRVFQHHQPRQRPCRGFAEGDVAVAVGRPGDRDGGGQFGIAQPGERARQRRDHERQHHPGPGELGRGRTGHHIHAGTEDVGHAQHQQAAHAEPALQPGAIDVGHRHVDRLAHARLRPAPGNGRAHAPPPPPQAGAAAGAVPAMSAAMPVKPASARCSRPSRPSTPSRTACPAVRAAPRPG